MKEEMRKYFPNRFPDTNSESTSIWLKPYNLLYATDIERRRLRCELKVMNLFQESMELKILVGALKKHGCNFDLSRHISCEPCFSCAGGYDPDTNQIIICQNQTLNKNRIMSTIAHELIHMFDYCRAKFDFNNLEHIACSEIRAANLTYCSLADKLQFDNPKPFTIKATQQYCVKDVAFRSTKAYAPDVDEMKVWETVSKVFPGCYRDLEPFGRRLTNGPRAIRQAYRERFYYGYG